MIDLLKYNNFYLIGIKGVAMTSLAQCLLDAGKQVAGCDVSDTFVTQPILDTLHIEIDDGFEVELPSETECVIYTAAHQGPSNPAVINAQAKELPVVSQAEAIGSLFNQQFGIAVCGVGGKSTTSAMLTWVLSKVWDQPLSFSVGVGDIPGLARTGQWHPTAGAFVVEADDYVVDPLAPQKGEEITPRFSFLEPKVIICTNLQFDHPDVYLDFEHTKKVFKTFFEKLPSNEGVLIINGDDQPLWELAHQVTAEKNIQLISYGFNSRNTWRVTNQTILNQTLEAELQSEQLDTPVKIMLKIPGLHNLMNGLATVVAAHTLGIEPARATTSLQDFRSTKRRFEVIGNKKGVMYFDDYAHHPHEVKAALEAIYSWCEGKRVVVAFQSHTYSRTKELFNEFVQAFEPAATREVILIDIFASAREQYDPSVTADGLTLALKNEYPEMKVINLHSIENLAQYCQEQLQPGDVFLTLGAGDIYLVHDILGAE